MEQAEQTEHVDNQLINFLIFCIYLKFYLTIFNLNDLFSAGYYFLIFVPLFVKWNKNRACRSAEKFDFFRL